MLVVSQKIKTVYLYVAGLVLALGMVLVICTAKTEKKTDYDILYNSSKRMEMAINAVRLYCEQNNIQLEEGDINKTYLLGPEFSELVSTMGWEDLKRTTHNPNNAAVVASYFLKAGLKPGDVVGVGSSGSFPGYAIATLCAATELGLKTKVIASYGSSMFGASRPELNIVTILNIVKNCGAADFDLIAVSPGSSQDKGVGAFDGLWFENTRDLVLDLASQSGVCLIDPGNMIDSIEQRFALFGKIDCFVNIGGAGANSGIGSSQFPPGLTVDLKMQTQANDEGLVFEYAKRGIPVINLLNVRAISAENGLELDPYPVPECGEGGVYYQTDYSEVLIVTVILMAFTILLYGVLKQKSSGTRK